MSTGSNLTGTNISTINPGVTFAMVTNFLGNFDVVIPDTVKIYIVDPYDITLDYFKMAFYAANSNNLKYFNPTDTLITNSRDIAILKNLLFLNSGGGTFNAGTPNEVTLPKKTITFNGGAPEDFIIFSFVVKDIADKSGFEYETWSIDSQIDISRKLAEKSYIYEFPIVTTGTSANTNALTYSELEKVVNIAIYKYANENSLALPSQGDIYTVNLNFAVNFKALIGVGSATPEETVTQVLFQYRITDWEFSALQN